jgi:hypothetical protein
MSTMKTQLIRAIAAEPTEAQLAKKAEDFGTLRIFVRSYSDHFIARVAGGKRRCSCTMSAVQAATRMAMLTYGVPEKYFTLHPIVHSSLYTATLNTGAKS